MSERAMPTGPLSLDGLRTLEAESIHILREAVAEFESPVLLYSMGKDSSVLLHLARKAFHPAPLPFPLLNVDAGWEFRETLVFRDAIARTPGIRLIVHTNAEGQARGINPFDFGIDVYTNVMRTEALKQALAQGRFDCAFGGARRDEERSRAKERVFSFRDRHQQWDPRNQRPEVWALYNGRRSHGETARVFPMSNWTELDVWAYIWAEAIPLVPLYFAAPRPVVERGEALLVVDDERFPLRAGEIPRMRSVRFRTLGCYPLSAAVESTAATVLEVIQETLVASSSERRGRLIDHDTDGSMEKKKREGYF